MTARPGRIPAALRDLTSAATSARISAAILVPSRTNAGIRPRENEEMGFYRTRLGCGAEAEMLTKRSNHRVHGGARRKTGNRDSAVSAEWVIRHRVYLI